MKVGFKHVRANIRLMGRRFVLFAFLGICTELLFLYLPQVIKRIILILETQQGREALINYGKIAFMIVTVYIIIDALNNIYGTYLSSYIHTWKDNYYRKKYLETNYARVEKAGIGKLQSRIGGGMRAEINITFAYWGIFLGTFLRGGVLVATFMIHEPRLAWILLGLMSAALLLHYLTKHKIRALASILQRLHEQSNRDFLRIAMHHLLIVISGNQSYEMKKSAETLDKFPPYEVEMKVRQSLPFTLLYRGLRMLEIGIYVVIGFLVLKEERTIADITMYVFYMWLFWGPVERVIDTLGTISRDREYATKLFEFFEERNKIEDGENEFSFKGGTIVINDLTFCYEGKKPVFQNFSLMIEGSQKTAVVGLSGGGKSTLMKLLLRIYPPQGGEILIDGQNLMDLKQDSYYRHIGYLSQEPNIFDGTIRENLLYAVQRDILPEELDAAIQLAQCEFVYEMPEGLETEIGEKGIRLSGGQRQRLAIAKIFLKNPGLVILDEPTSALDSFSEEAISEAMNTLFRGRTVIIIAHRLQTVKEADDIIVLGKNPNPTVDGALVLERGTHKELMALKGEYERMVRLQTAF